MAMSGIEIDDECKQTFDDMKISKKGAAERRKVSAFIINDDKTRVVVDRELMNKTCNFLRDKDHDKESFEELKAILKKDYCHKAAYILIDFNFRDEESHRDYEKLAYIYWCPDSCSIKEKMVYASTHQTLKKKFDTNLAIECHDDCDLDYMEIIKALKK